MSDTETCGTCGHLFSQHTPLAGCLHADGSRYCDCAATPPATSPAVRAAAGLAEGRALRDEGMAKAGSGVPGISASDWRLKADKALRELANAGTEFSADDVVEQAGPPPHPNMLGPLFANAARADAINAVGFRQGARASAHARIQRTWKGKS